MCRSSGILVYIFIPSLMPPSFLLRAQSLTQAVSGKITEQDSRLLLPGVNVVVVGADVPEMELQEFIISMAGVVITAHQNKSQIITEMALISARGFTVEETKRYAGSFNALASMVSGYAGVRGDASANSEKVFRYLC